MPYTVEQIRRSAVYQSQTSLRLEGGEVSAFARRLQERWVRQEIGMDEVIRLTIAHQRGKK